MDQDFLELQLGWLGSTMGRAINLRWRRNGTWLGKLEVWSV